MKEGRAELDFVLHSKSDYLALSRHISSNRKQYAIYNITGNPDRGILTVVQEHEYVAPLLHKINDLQYIHGSKRPIKGFVECHWNYKGRRGVVDLHRRLETELRKDRLIGNLSIQRELGVFQEEILGFV